MPMALCRAGGVGHLAEFWVDFASVEAAVASLAAAQWGAAELETTELVDANQRLTQAVGGGSSFRMGSQRGWGACSRHGGAPGVLGPWLRSQLSRCWRGSDGRLLGD